MSLKTEETKTAQGTDQGTETKTQAAENGLPKTQEELDAIIDARLARERKNGKTAAGADSTCTADSTAGTTCTADSNTACCRYSYAERKPYA